MWFYMSTAIEFNNISKQYHLGVVSTKTLAQDICLWWMNIMHEQNNDEIIDTHWALRDIDLKIEEGDIVGIVGKNGAGKSTMLKLLSRIVYRGKYYSGCKNALQGFFSRSTAD